MYESYLEKYYEHPESTGIFQEFAEYHTEEQVRRNEELFRFIDEFVASEEYEVYIRGKRNLRRRQAETQYSEKDIVKTGKQEMMEKYPLTANSKRIMLFEEQFKKFVENQKHQHVLKSQQKGIQMIKDKIREVRQVTVEQKLHKSKKDKEKHYARYIDAFCDKYNVALLSLKNEARKKATDKIICYQKVQHSNYFKRKNNVLNFLRKMVREDDRQKQIDKDLKKTYDYKVKKNDRIIQGMKIAGEKIILKPRYPEPETVEIPEEYIEPKKKDKKEASEKNGKDEPEMPKDEKGKHKSSKNTEKSKSNKSKKRKGPKEIPLILPAFPVGSNREKSTADLTGKMSDLIKEFNLFNEMLENRHIMRDPRNVDSLPDCKNELICIPSVLYFENFKNGCTYSRKLRILNASPQQQKFRMLKLITPNEYDILLFEIKPLLEIKKLASGCSVTLNVIFRPDYDHQPVQARIYFIKYNLQTLSYEKFSVNIHCIPVHALLKISCKDVDFGTIPKWRIRGDNRKVVKFSNDGSRACKIIIKKIATSDTNLDYAEYEDDAEKAAEEIIRTLINNVSSYFRLESIFFTLEPHESVNVNVSLKNVEHAGIYYGKYCTEVYEKNGQEHYVGSQVLSFHAEITEHFIVVAPDVLDFGVCSTESILQLSLDIFNRSPSTHTLSIRFPSSVSSYISANVSSIYINGDSRRTIWVRFFPRKDIFERPPTCFDSENNILEFPIRIYIVSKNHFNAPPVQATVYAALLNEHNLTIEPMSEHLTVYRPNEAVLNLGECSLFETVSTEFMIKNETSLPQVYGFFNVPQCITILPNYGYGELQVGESRVLQLFFHPDENVAVAYQNGKQMIEYQKNIILKLDTINNLKQLKRELNLKRLKESFAMVIREMKKLSNVHLDGDIKKCVSAVRSAWFPKREKIDVLYARGPGEFDETPGKTKAHRHMIAGLSSHSTEPSRKSITGVQLTLQAKIIRPLVELSSQYIIFPNTPCGSFSYVEIEIRAVAEEFLSRKHPSKLPGYEAFFRITGDNNAVKAEPSCGVLKNGERKKIILMAKPTVPEELVVTQAMIIKYNEIYERRKQEFEKSKLKKITKKCKNKDKKVKKSKATSKKEKKSKDDSPKKAKSKNSRSNKIHNSDNDIDIMYNLLNPVGVFSIPYAKSLRVPPEYFIKLPLKFEPKGEGNVEEYFEITSGRTTIPLIFEGVGIMPNVKITPAFRVYRLEAPSDGVTEVKFSISNATPCKVLLNFQKLVEINGYMQDLSKNEEPVLEKVEKCKAGDKKYKTSQKTDQKTDKDKSSKTGKGKVKVEKMSQNLTKVEECSIPFFGKHKGVQYFDVLSTQHNPYTIEGNSSKSITLLFGNPKVIQQKKVELLEKEANKGKGKQKGKNKEAKKRSNRNGEGSSKEKSTEPIKYYVAKYNICLKQEFLRDVILIGSFK
ncbi:unnamed protein product [Acanthoscelides obtectus]|uniref:Uncharacterized protein n=1 Tax=Acanthoscelides obtectus TaxID=200917 RepID=A0A9P0NSS3_ACAOB|nr:unnamed protein product [Acanthoscelides obtectus]CAK1639977.1 Cilia- and flagella-associated protein 74 [Acanthoscelides obtectus]